MKSPSRGRLAATMIGLALLAGLAVGGCTRLDAINQRLKDIPDDQARTVLQDVLWADGSKYRWVDHRMLRAEVTWTEHRPLGDAASDEVWLLDLEGGKYRIEIPARRLVVVYDGGTVRVFVDGKSTDDLEARALAIGKGRIITELLPMPFSLAGPHLGISYAGSRVGPAEAHTWQRLLVAYGPETGRSADDRMTVEVRPDLRRVDDCLIRWSELPFVGRRMRVLMDDWRDVAGISLSHRWRFEPIDAKDEATGPMLYSVQIRRAAFDPPVGWLAFSRP